MHTGAAIPTASLLPRVPGAARRAIMDSAGIPAAPTRMEVTVDMKILCATDGTEAAQAGAGLIRALGRRRAEVTVVCVVDTEPAVPAEYYLKPEVLGQLREDAAQIAGAAAAALREGGFQAIPKVLEGGAGTAIVDAAHEGEYDLVALGAGRHSWLGALLMGSTSTYVLHACEAPLLIVHEPPPPGVDKLKVLLAGDDSPASDRARQLLAAFADPERCVVTVMSVAQVPYSFTVGHPGGTMAGSGTHLVTELIDKARESAERAAVHLREDGFTAETLATDGVPHHQVLEQAKTGGYHLVVVGSSGQGPLRRSLMGSVSEAVVRHAPAAMVGRAPGPR